MQVKNFMVDQSLKEQTQHRTVVIGLLLVRTGAIFWGVGGTVAQKLFQQYATNVN